MRRCTPRATLWGSVGQVRCFIGEAPPWLGYVVSSTLVRCEAPAHAEGAAGVAVGAADAPAPDCADGGDDGGGARSVAFLGDAAVWGVVPARGPAAGGTLVTLRGDGLGAPAAGAWCRFGTVAVAAAGGGAAAARGGSVVCVAPAAGRRGAVPVTMATAAAALGGETALPGAAAVAFRY